MFVFLSLIRWVNLLYILLTLCLLRFLLIEPIYQLAGYQPTLGVSGFLVLVLSVMLVAAAGYVINDYFDVAADRLNKPDKTYVGNQISAQNALNLYYLLNSGGILMGFAIGWYAGNYKTGFVHLASAILLWFYSTTFKRRAFIGNLLVSGLVALSIYSIAFFDAELLAYIGYSVRALLKSGLESITGLSVSAPQLTTFTNAPLFGTIMLYISGYAGFAFLLNLVRELAKDMEDIEGDEEAGYKTLPIVAGIPFTKLLAAAVALITINFIAKFQINHFITGQAGVAAATLLLVQIPLLYVVYKLWKASGKQDFAAVSKLVKALMLVGLLYLPYLRASMQFVEPQMQLPPGIESITFDLDTTQTQQPDTVNYIIDTQQGVIREDTSVNQPKQPAASGKKNGNKPIDDDLLK